MVDISPQEHWQAEYEFFTRIIGDEVARLRWNEGFEPLQCDLYPFKDQRGYYSFVGTTRICGRDFECKAHHSHDGNGRPILKLSIRVSSRPKSH